MSSGGSGSNYKGKPQTRGDSRKKQNGKGRGGGTGVVGKGGRGAGGANNDRGLSGFDRADDRIFEKMDYEESNAPRAKEQSRIDGHRGFDTQAKYGHLMTMENYKHGSDVTHRCYDIIVDICIEFRKEDEVHAPMFLWNLFGTYVVRSIYMTEWIPEQAFFWIGDTRLPTARWNLTEAQLGLRYAMLKEFQKRLQEELRGGGYPSIEVLYNPDVSWPEIVKQ